MTSIHAQGPAFPCVWNSLAPRLRRVQAPESATNGPLKALNLAN